jgi:hypothetical protein
MADDSVQRSGGDALWHTVRYALQSRVVKALAVGIAGAAVVVLGRSHGAP